MVVGGDVMVDYEFAVGRASSRTTASCPLTAALISAVRPSLSFALTSAWASISSCTTCLMPVVGRLHQRRPSITILCVNVCLGLDQ